MITIIIGTNRADAKSVLIANMYSELLTQNNVTHQILNLQEHQIFYKNEVFNQLENQFLIPTEKYLIILPEYNGSFPGVFKMLIDNSDIKQSWWYKKAMLVGVASGRGGNLRGLEHMVGILQYLKVNVHWNKMYFSSINDHISEGTLHLTPSMLNEINTQIKNFIEF